jgi:NTP pyrophosphatase (non-canonical NTP hydrolase)
MIIVEGPDGAGKTTLIRYLHKQLDIELSEHSRLSSAERNDPSYRDPKNVRKRYYKALTREVVGVKPPELHDRLFYSELVYNEVLGNREPCFDFHESRHYSRILSALEVPVIFCLPPFREIQKQMLQTEQWDEAAQRILDIYNKYKLIAKFMSRQKIKGITNRDQPYDYNQPKVILYDYTRPDSKDIVMKRSNEVSRQASTEEQRMELDKLQKDSQEWREKSFPPEHRTAPLQALGVCEEAGELAHAILKMEQGIRGDTAAHMAEAIDAVGDIVIYLCGLCTTLGLNIERLHRLRLGRGHDSRLVQEQGDRGH